MHNCPINVKTNKEVIEGFSFLFKLFRDIKNTHLNNFNQINMLRLGSFTPETWIITGRMFDCPWRHNIAVYRC